MLTALVCSLIGFILGAKWACSMGDKLCAMCWINQPYLKKPYVDYDQYLPQPEWHRAGQPSVHGLAPENLEE